MRVKPDFADYTDDEGEGVSPADRSANVNKTASALDLAQFESVFICEICG
jgi:hypothetical protein